MSWAPIAGEPGIRLLDIHATLVVGFVERSNYDQ